MTTLQWKHWIERHREISTSNFNSIFQLIVDLIEFDEENASQYKPTDSHPWKTWTTKDTENLISQPKQQFALNLWWIGLHLMLLCSGRSQCRHITTTNVKDDRERGELTMFKTSQIFGEKTQYRLHPLKYNKRCLCSPFTVFGRSHSFLIFFYLLSENWVCFHQLNVSNIFRCIVFMSAAPLSLCFLPCCPSPLL